MPLDLDVEIARPDKAEHCASEAANETHQNGEVGNEDGHQYGGYNDADTEAQTPNLQFPVRFQMVGNLVFGGPLKKLRSSNSQAT